MGPFRRRKRASGEAEDETAPTAAPPGQDRPLASLDAVIDRELHRIAEPGTWWSGGERAAIAADARAFLHGDEPSGLLPPPVAEATEAVAVAAATIRPSHLGRWAAQGLEPLLYIELVGIVSRLAALDVATFGIGRRRPELRPAVPGEPHRQVTDTATVSTGWVPTVGPASAPSSLSAVPAEQEAMFDLHRVLYLPLEEMLDVGAARDGLSRPQLELVAARTSALNDCFY